MSDKTLQQEMAELREAWLDFFYELMKPFVLLTERIPGLQLKPWARERRIREQWRR
jgi:hypothetical protein